MSQYAEWLKLEELLTSNDSALKQVAAKYPQEIMKWLALRRRMGAQCPTARGVLKLICFYEANNEKFIKAVNNNVWDTESI
jgi:hypothetical protein